MASIDRVTKVNITSSISPPTTSATFTPSFDNSHILENVPNPPRALDAKRPPPLELSISNPDTNIISPRASLQTTPKSATNTYRSYGMGISPKICSNVKMEVSPSHPYYQGNSGRQSGTSNSVGSRLNSFDGSDNASPATVIPPGMQPIKKKFVSPLNLGNVFEGQATPSFDPTARPERKRPPAIQTIQKRRSMVYTREQLQELVQIRASETKLGDISEEHKAAIKKFLDDKATILKCEELCIGDLEKQKELGFGNSGNVSKKQHMPSGVIMACKTIKLEIKEAQRNAILSELHVLHDCSSPYIVGFFGSFCHNMDLEICMELMDGGSLDQVVRVWGRIEEDVIAVITRAVLHGLHYLFRELNILHRDVKPSNILLNSLGEVKLCDFGVSKKLLDTKGVANTFVGTRSYMAPERLKGSHYSLKSDLWSLGISLIELAIGKYPIPPLPFDEIDTLMCLPSAGSENQTPLPPSHFDHPLMAPFEMLQYVAMEEPPTMPRSHFTPELCDFTDLCLMRDPEKRASVGDLMERGFFTTEFKVDMAAWVVRVSQQGQD